MRQKEVADRKRIIFRYKTGEENSGAGREMKKMREQKLTKKN